MILDSIKKIDLEPGKTDDIGQGMYQLITQLYPICRSITGNGFRETLNILKDFISLDIITLIIEIKIYILNV